MTRARRKATLLTALLLASQGTVDGFARRRPPGRRLSRKMEKKMGSYAASAGAINVDQAAKAITTSSEQPFTAEQQRASMQTFRRSSDLLQIGDQQVSARQVVNA